MVEDENTKNPSGLSEFFNVLSTEKAEARQKIKEKIDDPESGLSGLFQQLEEALQETINVSVEEDSDNTKLSVDDQNKLEVFSNLLNELGSDKEIPIKKVEPTDFVEELEPEEIIPEELVVESEEPHEITEPQNNIITSVIRNLEDMSRKTQVKEEVEQIFSIRKEFDNFRSLVAQQISSLQMPGAGSGETRLEFLDDVDRATAKVNDKALVYDSSSGKWKGETILTAAITGLDIDGGTDIGAALVDADEIIVDDGGGGTNRRCDMSRVKTYVGGDSTPLFSAFHNAAQTISNDTLTQVQFNTESTASGGAAGIDLDSKFASNAFTPTVAGYYFFHFQTTFAVTDNEAISVHIRRNGGVAVKIECVSSASGSQTNGFQISGMIYLDSDDNADIAVYCTSDDVGLNGLASGSIVITMFQGWRLTGV